MSDHNVADKVTVYQGRRISVVKKTLELADGRTVTRETIEHPGAVIIIPVTNNGDIILLDQFRFSIEQRIYEFPAGTREPNESTKETALRELAEETKYSAKNIKSLGQIIPTPGFCNEIQEVFIASDLFDCDKDFDEGEDIKICYFSPSGIKKMIQDGQIQDAKTIASFYKAILSGDIIL